MSNIMVYDIVGTGIYAVPVSSLTARAASLGFRSIITAIPDITVPSSANINAWVIDSQTAGGGEGDRSLACLISGFEYEAEVCPNESEVDALTAIISAALLAASGSGTITSIGPIEVNLFDGGSVGP